MMGNKRAILLMRAMIILAGSFGSVVAILVITSQVREIAALAASRSAGCGLYDVLRSRHEGLNPVDPEVAASVRVITSADGLTLADSLMGKFWIRTADFQTLGEMVAEEREGIYDVGGHGVRRGDVVLDCGANVGVYTRHALMRGARKVVAIEPAPESIACLRRNFSQEILNGQVVVYPKGVWDREGSLVLHACGHSWCDSVVEDWHMQGERTVTVPLTTIDQLVRDLKLERVDFIKMDIEGAERQALHGAVRTVAAFHPRLAVALEHLANDAEELPALVRQLWPGTETECGPCSLQIPGLKPRVQPQVVIAY